MQLAVRGKNIEVTNALREYVEKKVGRLARLMDVPVNAQVNMYVERGRHKVEVTATMNGMIIRGEESSPDMYASIDRVSDKLERQINKYKTRLRRSRGKENGISEAAAPVVDEAEGTLVKTKSFQIKPMPVEEASMQMELLGHDFYVFTNAENMRINVLYKRKDGNYGLLVPEA